LIQQRWGPGPDPAADQPSSVSSDLRGDRSTASGSFLWPGIIMDPKHQARVQSVRPNGREQVGAKRQILVMVFA
jgi:hypothetical protein